MNSRNITCSKIENFYINDNTIMHLFTDKGVCKIGGDCLCLRGWSGAFCDQSKQINILPLLFSRSLKCRKSVFLCCTPLVAENMG